MSMDRGRAATVGLSEPGQRALREALAGAGYDLAGCAPDGAAGLRLVEALQPDVVIAAAVMPGMDGVAFARRVRGLRLNLRPGLVLLRPFGLRLPGGEGLDALDAVAIGLPVDARELRGALAALASRPRTLPPDKVAQLEKLLTGLGVPEHPGRDCLARAVALIWHDRRRLRALKDDLYPELARQTGLTPAQVERAIRHVIDAAWRNGEIEYQHRIFGDTIDARRGKPTCGEMIAQLAEELRWED